MDFTLTDDERAVMDTGVSVAGAADPWAALEEGGWLDILLEDEQGMAYLGLMAEALGAAGVSVPLAGTAVVWPTCFGGSAGGRRVGVADATTLGNDAVKPVDDGLLCEDGVGADVIVVLRDGRAGIHEVFSAEPEGGLEGDRLGRDARAGFAAFLTGAFLAALLAGAAAFWAFFGSSTPTSLAARSPTARVWVATLPSASWVSSTAWSE